MDKENKSRQSYRLSPEVIRVIESFSNQRGISKTEVLETAILDYAGRNSNESVILQGVEHDVYCCIQQLEFIRDDKELSKKGTEVLKLLNDIHDILYFKK